MFHMLKRKNKLQQPFYEPIKIGFCSMRRGFSLWSRAVTSLKCPSIKTLGCEKWHPKAWHTPHTSPKRHVKCALLGDHQSKTVNIPKKCRQQTLPHRAKSVLQVTCFCRTSFKGLIRRTNAV